MRFALLVAGTLASGGWAAGVGQGVLPGPNQMIQAVTALGGDPTKVRTGGINLLQTYNDVMRQVTSGKNAVPTGFQSTPMVLPPGSFQGMNTPNIVTGPGMANGFNNSAIVSQIQQNNQRMQDMAAYTRNPAGWHGMPPH